jgi:hypothetical protein
VTRAPGARGSRSWFALVSPVNAFWAAATPATPPPDWQTLRARWEFGHAVHAGLLFAGFTALLVSILVDSPSTRRCDGHESYHRAA